MNIIRKINVKYLVLIQYVYVYLLYSVIPTYLTPVYEVPTCLIAFGKQS